MNSPIPIVEEDALRKSSCDRQKNPTETPTDNSQGSDRDLTSEINSIVWK